MSEKRFMGVILTEKYQLLYGDFVMFVKCFIFSVYFQCLQ